MDLTYVRSKGCPTRTHAIPPNPPDRNDFTGSTVDFVSCRKLSRSDAESDILDMLMSRYRYEYG
jgi:hypothetical protein